MLNHTTCAGCNGTLTYAEGDPVNPGYASHPQCPQPGDQVSLLRQEMIEAIYRGDDDLADQLCGALDTYDTRPPDMSASAQLYAAWGWPIFPLKPGLKVPMVQRGLNAATTDTDMIEDWWWRWPHAGIAVATGWMFDVIDIDGAHGYRWLAHNDRQDGAGNVLPDVHARAATPRGMHLYVKPSGSGNLAGFADGVDYRGRGGYVVLPPTRLTEAAYEGKHTPVSTHYSWATYPSPSIKRKAVTA